MSTTVNYKGNTIATLSNETKTLTTAGTWVEGDIEIVDTKDAATLQSKTATPTESSQTITPDIGYDGLSSVQINAMPTMTLPTSASSSSSGTSKATIGRSTSAQYINIPTGYNGTASYYTISATPNGTVTAPSSISGTAATITTGTNTLTLTKTISVTPNVTTAGYISSGTAGNASVSLTASVNIRTSSDLTVSGATVTAPAGYYSADTSKSVSSMTLPTSAAASATSGFTSKATISRSTSDQYINIPVGYNASGAYYKINAVANGTEGIPTATKSTVSNHQVTVTPSVTNSAGYITGGTKTGTAVTVTASELASGNKEITENGTNIDVVGYSTISVDVSTSNWDSKVSQNVTIVADNPNYFIVSPYTEGFHENETYRVTWGNETYICQTKPDTVGFSYDGYYIGNSVNIGGENTGEPFLIYQRTANQLAGGTNDSAGTIFLSIEKQTSGSVFISKTISANGNYFPNDDSADAYSSVIVAIPFSTITVSSSNPSGGSDGDVWIKTS